MHKPSNLLSRRKTSLLLCNQSTDFSSGPHPIDPSSLQDPSYMHVQIPRKSYKGLGYLLYRIRYMLWEDVVPHNTLNQSFFISLDSLTFLRQITMSLYTSCFTWQIMKIFNGTADTVSLETSWLSFWGLLLGALYFLLTLISQDEADTSFLWKFTYIIGEISIAIEFLILSLNFPSLISDFSGDNLLNFDETAYKVCITILCPLFAIAEIAFNHIAFPKCHRSSLCILAIIYLASELLWIVVKNYSLTNIMNYTEIQDYFAKGAVIGVVFLEFMLGNKFFDWKLLIKERSARKNPKKNA